MTCERPYNLVAELSYRCPLRCPYCSNPSDWKKRRKELDTDTWGRAFREASELGAVHVGLTGGEPAVRPDLPELVSLASEAQLYTHLVTAGTTIDDAALDALVRAGLRSVQLSLQDANAHGSDRIAGAASFDKKIAFARAVRRRGLPLVLNTVLHADNLDRVSELIATARELDAHRLELANVQYHGYARVNRAALLPSRAQLDRAAEIVRAARRVPGTPELVFVLPDHFSGRPKPCMGGWGRKNLIVSPSGRVLPCQEAGTLPLEFWSLEEHSLAECWADAPGMQAYRGTDWLPEPCRSCEAREQDFGGCRCQAFHFLGDAGATDPACALSPHHARLLEAIEEAPEPLRYRDGTPVDPLRSP